MFPPAMFLSTLVRVGTTFHTMPLHPLFRRLGGSTPTHPIRPSHLGPALFPGFGGPLCAPQTMPAGLPVLPLPSQEGTALLVPIKPCLGSSLHPKPHIMPSPRCACLLPPRRPSVTSSGWTSRDSGATWAASYAAACPSPSCPPPSPALGSDWGQNDAGFR